MNEKQLEQFITMQNDITNITKDVGEIKTALKDFIEKADTVYVNKLEFEPIKKVVYGMIGLILSGVLLAVIAFVLNKP